MTSDQNSKHRIQNMEKILNERLSLAGIGIKENLLSLYEYCVESAHDKILCEESFCGFAEKLNSEIEHLASGYRTDGTRVILEDCKRRVDKAITDCQSAVNLISVDNELDIAFGKLIRVIHEVFTTISDLMDAFQKQIYDLKSNVNALTTRITDLQCDVNALTTRQAINDYQLLVRELFNDVRSRIVNDIENVKLPRNHIDALYNPNITIERLNMEFPFLFYLVREVSNQFGLSTVDLIDYLRRKKNSNANFHLNQEIEEFAIRHSMDNDYNMDQFIDEEKLLIKIDPNEKEKLKSVFREVCRRLNSSSNAKNNENNHRFEVKQHIRVLYDDGKFYNGILMQFDQKTNRWRVRYRDRRFPPAWTIAARIFPVEY